MNFSIYLPLLKNKTVQLALGATLGILILLAILSPKRSVTQPIIPLSSPFRPELQNISETRRQSSATYLSTIVDKLPIYQDDIVTSVKLPTTLNIYRLDSDPAEVLRFEIYGISYLNANSTELVNPNLTAFKETFSKGLELLRSRGIDPSKLIFIYGDKQYVRDTATTWVTQYHLLP